jgi:hypothetical protein
MARRRHGETLCAFPSHDPRQADAARGGCEAITRRRPELYVHASPAACDPTPVPMPTRATDRAAGSFILAAIRGVLAAIGGGLRVLR